MKQNMSFAEAEALLISFVPNIRAVTGKDISIDRMQKIMQSFGNPQNKLKVIHVAGTSGKTSTSYYIASLLTCAGYATGLTVSPHVDTVRERVQVNLEPISEKAFADAFSGFMQLLPLDLKPTYFETLVAFAYWYFDKIGVDYAVIETGLGGLQDGTNVATRPDKICVITDIGYDHMPILGDTLDKIAIQKAGIIHEQNHLFCYWQDKDVLEAILKRAEDKHAVMHIVSESNLLAKAPDPVRDLPAYQQRNWLLAKETYDYVAARDGLNALTSEHIRLSLSTQVPGRMDTVVYRDINIVMDGAHNEQKMQAFVHSFQLKYPGRKVPVMLALKQDKDCALVLPALKPITSTLLVTTFNTSQDLPAVSVDAAELAKMARKLGLPGVVALPNQQEALEHLLSITHDIAVTTGSFYLLGQVRKLLVKKSA